MSSMLLRRDGGCIGTGEWRWSRNLTSEQDPLLLLSDGGAIQVTDGRVDMMHAGGWRGLW